jgi:dephospho-CoA kinase
MQKQKKNKKFVIGLTGIFGSGKSTVANIFKSFGLKIIDADKIAHKYLLPGTKTYKRIVKYFGRGIIFKSGKEIDRRKLGKLAFANRKLLLKLNSIIHPEIIQDIKAKIKGSSARMIVLDAPLLLEAGLGKIVDELVVVIIDGDELIRRLLKKRSLERPEILKRIKSQIPLRRKKRVADFIIDNNGTVSETKKQVKRVIGLIKEDLWRN